MITLVAFIVGCLFPQLIVSIVVTIICRSRENVSRLRKLDPKPESKTCQDSPELKSSSAAGSSNKERPKSTPFVSGGTQYKRSPNVLLSKSVEGKLPPIKRKPKETSSRITTIRSESPIVKEMKSQALITEDTQAQQTQTSEIPEDNEKAISAKEYEDEIQQSMQPSQKGPEYEEVTYIMGPFSTYGEWNINKAKGKIHKQKTPELEITTEALHIEDKDDSHQRSMKKNHSLRKSNTTQTDDLRVTIDTIGTVKAIPKDQTKPHKLRKDRQEINPYRRVWVQSKIKEIGGHILNRETGKFVYYPPTPKEDLSIIPENKQQPLASSVHLRY